ncbi:putative nitro HBN1 [Cyphellophora attinorum]|uniref:Putative nitro HBN1 n=1 Tax=Cyphellophora attinorum TaxID=1664694 RepID=A0A0N0NLW5_9EURO|nr:putative nitro HBN1 [Phialophora attinorum]KPI39771.1 putative nitro HBN1 [Phialophora attinorum]
MPNSLVPLSFGEATHKRRTYRDLENRSTVADKTIISLAEAAIVDVPSAFNNQAARLTILFDNDHKKLWSITANALLAKIGEERWNSGTKDRIAGFAGAYGTILFWDDLEVAEKMRNSAPDIYKDKTDEWIHQSNGMHQYYLWTALEALGMGANLQHYNPLIDDEVRKTWRVPETWNLRAQMVFGALKAGSDPGEKEQKLIPFYLSSYRLSFKANAVLYLPHKHKNPPSITHVPTFTRHPFATLSTHHTNKYLAMSLLAITKATVPAIATAAAPFAAVYYWPKEPQVFHYIPKGASTPLLSLPRASVPIKA